MKVELRIVVEIADRIDPVGVAERSLVMAKIAIGVGGGRVMTSSYEKLKDEPKKVPV